MGTELIQCLQLNSTKYDGIVDMRFDPGLDVQKEGSDSNPRAQIATAIPKRPRLEWTTKKVSAHNTLFGIDGYAVSANALEAYGVTAAAGSSPRGTTGNKINVTNGVVVPMRLTADMTTAQIAYACYCGGIGAGTVPYTVTTGQTVPTGPTLSEAFALGAITRAGSAIGGVTSCNIDFGFAVTQQMDPGKEYPVLVYILTHEPVISIGAMDDSLLNALTPAGSGDAIVITLKKKAAAGAYSGSGDITLTTNLEYVAMSNWAGTHNNPAEASVDVHCLWDTVNAPIVVS